MSGGDSKLGLQLMSQCGSMYNCLLRSVPDIYFVTWTSSNQGSEHTNIPKESVVLFFFCGFVFCFVFVFVPHGLKGEQ